MDFDKPVVLELHVDVPNSMTVVLGVFGVLFFVSFAIKILTEIENLRRLRSTDASVHLD